MEDRARMLGEAAWACRHAWNGRRRAAVRPSSAGGSDRRRGGLPPAAVSATHPGCGRTLGLRWRRRAGAAAAGDLQRATTLMGAGSTALLLPSCVTQLLSCCPARLPHCLPCLIECSAARPAATPAPPQAPHLQRRCLPPPSCGLQTARPAPGSCPSAPPPTCWLSWPAPAAAQVPRPPGS